MESKNVRAGRFRNGAFLATLFWIGWTAQAQVTKYTPGEYPAPKDPTYKSNVTVEDLLPIARIVVRKPARQQPLEPGYGIRAGERIVIIVPDNFDDRVLEAIRRAMVEMGGEPDVIKYFDGERAKINTNVGDQEVRFHPTGSGPMPSGFDFPKALAAGGDRSPRGKYVKLLYGTGGPIPASNYHWEYIPWNTVDKFMFSQAAIPQEIQDAIDTKLWEKISAASSFHATDPEGTDLTWIWKTSWIAIQAKEYPALENGRQVGHDSMNPQFNNPGDTDANGTISGTINHTGSYPNIRLTLKNGEIVRIEGGGEYGKRWQDMLDACRGIRFPGFPGPGCGWWEESAIGTDVWRARSLLFNEFAGEASWERGRAGVIHWGLGVSRNVETLSEVRHWYETNKTPAGTWHGHVHTYFNTVDITDVNGKVFRLIDKGHLTLLDDPGIRAVAARFGNPGDLLTEKWVPAIPGINVPGNYLTDYGRDPFKVISAHLTQVKNRIQATVPEPRPETMARRERD